MKTKALWHLDAHHSALQEIPLTEQQDEQWISVKSLFSLISTGTEYLVASGNVPKALHQVMRVPFMDGEFSFPIKYGYSVVGEIISSGKDHGKIVHLLHPHQHICQVKKENIYFVPDNVPAKRASLASNVETALNAIWDSNVSIGDRVLVVGFGMIGALVTRLLSLMPAVDCHIVETNLERQQLAKQMGFSVMDLNSSIENFDIAFHSSASSTGLQSAIEAVGFEGKVIELSWYGEKETQIALGGSFHHQRKQIISSQVGHLPSHKIARWTYHRRKEIVFQLLQNDLFDQHISHAIKFDDSPQFFNDLRKGQLPSGLGWCIDYHNFEKT